MPREFILRMRLTSHMEYDCQGEDQQSGVLADTPTPPASFSWEPVAPDQPESASQEKEQLQPSSGRAED